jgi:hypothetical protein
MASGKQGVSRSYNEQFEHKALALLRWCTAVYERNVDGIDGDEFKPATRSGQVSHPLCSGEAPGPCTASTILTHADEYNQSTTIIHNKIWYTFSHSDT